MCISILIECFCGKLAVINTFYNGQGEVITAIGDNKVVKANVTVSTTDAPKEFTAVLAVYNEYGGKTMLVGVDFKNGTATTTGAGDVVLNVSDIPNDPGKYYAKVFVFNSIGNAVPLEKTIAILD